MCDLTTGCAAFISLLTKSAPMQIQLNTTCDFRSRCAAAFITLLTKSVGVVNPVGIIVYIYIYIYRWLEPPIIHGVEWMELVVVLRSMLHKLEEVGFPHEHICTGLTTCSFSSFESLSSRAKGKGPYYHWYHDGCVLGF